MKTLFKIYILLFACSIYSQTEELSRLSEVNEFIKELTKKDIDTICDYEVFPGRTGAKFIQYVFWKENGKTKLKKIEWGKNYAILEIQLDSFWQPFIANMEELKTEKTEFFSFIQKVNNKDEIQTVVQDEGNIREFNLLLHGNIVKFWADGFDFQQTTKVKKKKVTNIYFEHNNNLKGKLIIDKLAKITTQLEKEKSFKNES